MMTPASVAQSVLDPAGPAAAHIMHLWWVMFWVTTAVFALTMAFLAWGFVRGTRRSPHGDRQLQLTSDPTIDRALTGSVAMAVGATVVILFGVPVASFF